MSAIDIDLIRSIFSERCEQRRWVAWREEPHKVTGRLTKIPYSPVQKGWAKSNDPSTWGTLDEALHAYRVAQMHGIGIMFDPRLDDLGGEDLDSCRDPETGAIAVWAQQQVDAFRTYTEVSPSGTGLKLYATGAPAELPANKIPIDAPPMNGKPAAIEAYVTLRWFAVTGQIVSGVPDEIVGGGDAWDLLVAELRKHCNKSGDGERIVGTATGSAEISAILQGALGTDTQLKALWADGTQGGTDRSRNDAALAAALGDRGFTDPDIEAALRAYPIGQVRDTQDDRQVGRLLGIAAKARDRYDEAEYARLERDAIQADGEVSSDGTPAAEALAPPTWRTLADIDDAPPGELICGMLEPDGPTLIYATGGTGKGTTGSWLIAECLKLGIRPLVYDAEGHPKEWRRRTSGLSVAPAEVVYVEPKELPKELLGKPLHEVVPYLGKVAQHAGCGLLIVDSILAAANLSEEGLKSDAAAPYLYASALGKLGILSVSFGHPSKHAPTGDPYGSVSWTNAMRLTWMGTRAEGDGHSVRWVPRKWNDRGHIPSVLLTFEYDQLGRPCNVVRADDEAVTRQWILELLPRTVQELAEEAAETATDGSYDENVRRSKDRIRQTLSRLRRAGLVKKPRGRNTPWEKVEVNEETRKDLT